LKTTKASLITKVVIFILIVYLSITLLNLRSRIQTANDHYNDVQSQVVTQNAKNAALEEHIRNSDDKDTVLEIAKEKLGLVEEGEVVFYDTTN
jgi:cell division protein DivIC